MKQTFTAVLTAVSVFLAPLAFGATGIGYTGTFTGNFTGTVNSVGVAQNVLSYNADPTGVLDSTAAIQAAINAATNGSTVIFPQGTFLVAHPPLLITNAGITLKGTSSTTLSAQSTPDIFGTKLYTTATNVPLIQVDAGFTVIEGLNLGGPYPYEWTNSVAIDFNGIHNDGLQECIVTRCYMTNWWIDIRASNTVHLDLNHNLIVGFVSNGVQFVAGAFNDEWKIEQNSIGYCYATYAMNGATKYGIMPTFATNQIGIQANGGLQGSLLNNDINYMAQAMIVRDKGSAINMIGNNFESYFTNGNSSIFYFSNCYGLNAIGNLPCSCQGNTIRTWFFLENCRNDNFIFLNNPNVTVVTKGVNTSAKYFPIGTELTASNIDILTSLNCTIPSAEGATFMASVKLGLFPGYWPADQSLIIANGGYADGMDLGADSASSTLTANTDKSFAARFPSRAGTTYDVGFFRWNGGGTSTLQFGTTQGAMQGPQQVEIWCSTGTANSSNCFTLNPSGLTLPVVLHAPSIVTTNAQGILGTVSSLPWTNTTGVNIMVYVSVASAVSIRSDTGILMGTLNTAGNGTVALKPAWYMTGTASGTYVSQ
jgi:hypothetical protein